MISRKKAAIGAVVIMVVTAFFSSFFTFQVMKYLQIRSGNGVLVPFEVWQKYKKLDRVRQCIEQGYIEEPDEDKLLTGAIKGMVASLEDPYSYYFTAEEYKKFIEQIQGSYAGVGLMVTVDENDNLITVVKAFRDAPAAKAGIIAGDKIIKVDGYEVNGNMLDQAVAMMRGTPGTKVTVTIMRDGNIKDFEIERAVVEIPDLEYRMLDKGIGYIKLYSFDANAANNFREAVDELEKKGMKGLILDLRGNPGGILDVCVKIADILLPEGVVVYTEDRYGNRENYTSDKNSLGIPLAVLVDEYSASASEVLTGAIQDYGAGIVIGKKTFGKGIVQTPRNFEDGSALKLTTAKYFTPKGRDIHKKGIEPDIEVDMTEEAKEFLKENPGRELPLELDAPLLKAIEEIKKKLNGQG